MAHDHSRSRILRDMAEQITAQMPDELLSSPRPDLATSLVRQWQTYDGHASLIYGPPGQRYQHYFRPEFAADGAPLRFGQLHSPIDDWFRGCTEDWDFGEEELPRAIRHLNLGQSALVDSRTGAFLRLSINPKDRTRRIERLGPAEGPPAADQLDRNLLRAARRLVDSIFRGPLDDLSRDDLAASLRRQLTTHDGHALFLTAAAKFHVTERRRPDGMREVAVRTLRTGLPEKLRACGLGPDDVEHFLHLLNLGLTPEVTDEHGRRCRAVTEPKTANVGLELLDPTGPGAMPGTGTYFSM
jgi:hypothetical protein